ncbi:hypothetical protein [Streptomyces sp. NPDC058092]
MTGGRRTRGRASSVAQLENSVEAVRNLEFADEELVRIEEILKGQCAG